MGEGKGWEAGKGEQLRAFVIVTRDQHLCPACLLCWLLAFFTQVCQLDGSVLFTNEEAKVLSR